MVAAIELYLDVGATRRVRALWQAPEAADQSATAAAAGSAVHSGAFSK